LLDEENPMDLTKAKAISDTTQKTINSAKVKLDFLKATGGIEGSGFIPYEPRKPFPRLPKKEKRIK
jgi:hypothetical protein